MAARCYRLAPISGAGLRGSVVGCSLHTWRYGVRIPGDRILFEMPSGELFSIAVGFRSGNVRVG